MKPLRFILIFIFALFAGNILQGQIMRFNVTVTFTNYDYSAWCPEIGVVNGTYVYRYSIKLNDEGKIESIHWVVQDNQLYNQNGDKVIVVDTGHDCLAVFWDFYNNPAYYNNYDPGLVYSSPDGWLDEYMPLPEDLPIEGSFVALSFKMMVKGKKFDAWSMMAQLHRNSKGEITADVVK